MCREAVCGQQHTLSLTASADASSSVPGSSHIDATSAFPSTVGFLAYRKSTRSEPGLGSASGRRNLLTMDVFPAPLSPTTYTKLSRMPAQAVACCWCTPRSAGATRETRTSTHVFRRCSATRQARTEALSQHVSRGVLARCVTPDPFPLVLAPLLSTQAVQRRLLWMLGLLSVAAMVGDAARPCKETGSQARLGAYRLKQTHDKYRPCRPACATGPLAHQTHIDIAVSSTSCTEEHSPEGVPCFVMYSAECFSSMHMHSYRRSCACACL